MSSSSRSPPPTPPRSLIPILHASHQVVLYNPTSHAVTIHNRSSGLGKHHDRDKPVYCPYCDRPFNFDFDADADSGFDERGLSTTRGSRGGRAHNYFQLLEVSNESSRPGTPFGGARASVSTSPPRSVNGGGRNAGIATGTMAEGYFEAFFREEHRLGMGANGSVFLCQVCWFVNGLSELN